MRNKAILYVFTILLVFTIGCSEDRMIEEEFNLKITGKWYVNDPAAFGTNENSFYQFTPNGEMTYNFWSDNSFQKYLGRYQFYKNEMFVDYEMNVRYLQKVTFIDKNTVKFEKVEGSKFHALEGIYHKK